MKKLIKKIICRFLGWYIDPIFRELNTQQTKIEEYSEQLENCREQLLKANEQVKVYGVQLSDCQQKITKVSEEIQEMEECDGGLDSKQVAIVYAYRYLLNREPETPSIIVNNTLNWNQLRETILNSAEYKIQNSTIVRDMPYFGITVQDITYFYNHEDHVIPDEMFGRGTSWEKDNIENFVKISDEYHYHGVAPQTGLFLDIGGNIGTTSIYCRMKLKKFFHFIAFEPVSENAKLLAANVAFNGLFSDISIAQIALSNQVQENVGVQINHHNWGNSFLTTDGTGEESVATTTLDRYLMEHHINQDEIKYIWIDVEGHEFEVLEGSALLYETHRIPTCIEFNQDAYMEQQKYEKMLSLLEKYFRSFIVCSQITDEETPWRRVSELRLLWEEFNHKPCDLILM